MYIFSRDIANIIANYAAPMRIVSWIKPNMINNCWLHANPNAIGAEIDECFGGNIDLFNMRFDDIDIDVTIRNPCELVGKWFMQFVEYIDLNDYINTLSGNPSDWAGNIVMDWISKTDDWEDILSWNELSSNPAPWAIKILENNMINITSWICSNPSKFAIQYMQEEILYIDGEEDDWFINYDALNANPHPWAIKNVDITGRNAFHTSGNPNPDLIEFIRTGAISYLTNPVALAANPNIFKQNEGEILAIREVLYGH